MNKLIAIAIAALTLAVFTDAAQAQHRRIAYTKSCGHHVYQVQTFVGYDSCGRPVYRWITQPSSCRCSHRSHSHVHRSHYPSYHVPRHVPSYRSSHYRGSCYTPPPRCGSGFSIRFGF